eukprot:CAMPEP_0113481608 /NCGR_PEP_ID=MMETSP0014_2-20120614/22496_1 /TAXON_ID=2857 /ORGANISM="Nitzschia sp." /LENGTH=1474 /DNA_ID=CAMNT_0000375109 /DNA_START=515 /DNA_END=4939 /DNA_ORIENTATION=- /assembly_acc=CAM_ASM_000159
MAKSEDNVVADNASGGASDNGKQKNKETKAKQNMASITETMSFVFTSGTRNVVIWCVGMIAAVGNGATYPILAYLFSSSFTDIGAAASEGLSQIRELAYTFLILGVYALVCATVQTTCFEVVAAKGTEKLRLQWFHSLLRQDPAFFDVYDISGIASGVAPAANKYRRGVGRKFGEGMQFLTTGLGGIGYAMYASWRVALVVLSVTPLISVSALFVVSLNQSKSARAAKAYSQAGSVAYASVAGIKTVLSLNACKAMIEQYKEATQEAKRTATSVLIKQGFANGSMLGSFLMLYAILALYGASLLYKDIEETGCDPSAGVPGNQTCTSSGPDVFGAMLGVAFAAQGISQVGNALETFSAARVAVASALKAIKRTPGAPEEIIYYDPDDEKDTSVSQSTRRSSVDMETPEGRVKAILPPYTIDSSSDEGLKPKNVSGQLFFDNVEFSYPTRPGHTILNGLTLDIPAGKTTALVGPSGGGKSSIVKQILRYYDPSGGSIELDGKNLKDINVKHLRGIIGYVGQEPTLFATTIARNIQYGNPEATMEDIEQAAKLANAHDFISSLPDGYDTQVGDKGSQLSGGQKQRIAIARVLVADPKILLLDEATSALDAQSELVVQEALANIIATQKRTTIIIAHRLSTIRNADLIAVIAAGTVVETGTHDELIEVNDSHYKRLVDSQTNMTTSRSSSVLSKRESTMSAGGFESSEFLGPGGADYSQLPLIVFKNVSFSYPTRPNKTILNNMKLKIYRGETVALVGTSGGGKSTVMGMIERFYDPSDGVVEYFGADVRSLNVHWYRDQISYVGQEPVLFDMTIEENIRMGHPEATREDIEEAAKAANAYNFITSFPEGFETLISGGSGSTQLSGGQKQRVAIARALVRKPEILLLDEATSALDNESEAIVQEALDQLMTDKSRTIIVIAHRLTTIQNADRIAFISDGRVKEIGSHDELMEKPKGRYKMLVESSDRRASTATHGLEPSKKKTKKKGNKSSSGDETDDEEEEPDWKKAVEEEELAAFSMKRARQMAAPDTGFLLVGSLGALMAGSVFPMWGLLFAETIELLFIRVEKCDPDDLPEGFSSCEESWSSVADAMRERSYELAGFWTIVMLVCLFGNMLTFWGFGQASERMSKRVRDAAFSSLVRQEVAFFDQRSVGKITSELQEDAARVQTFTGEPVRSFLIAIASVFTGVILSFIFMWPFALLAIACIPLMGFATSLEMKNFLGEDVGDDNAKDETSSPSGIIMETLLNMNTVSSLNLEEERFKNFEQALDGADPHYVREGFFAGFLSGLSMFIQQWINALQLWWGGYLLFTYPTKYEFNDFLISNFAILFSLFGLGAAFQDISDRKETEKSASRIFYLLDRESKIDPMSDDGKKLDTSVERVRKKSMSKKRLSKSSSKKVVDDPDHSHTETSDAEEKPASSASQGSKKKKKKKKKSSKKLIEDETNAATEVAADGEDKPKKKKSVTKTKTKSKGKMDP